MRSILFFFIKSTFLLRICILNIARGVFNVKSLFSMVINILCSHAFWIKSYWSQKKILEIKSQNGRTLFSEIFYFVDFFRRTFYLPNLGLYFKNLFSKNFFGGDHIDNLYVIYSLPYSWTKLAETFWGNRWYPGTGSLRIDRNCKCKQSSPTN